MARAGGLICRKIKLKNFDDPKTADGCGVVRFLSAKEFFYHAVTLSAPRSRHDLFRLMRGDSQEDGGGIMPLVAYGAATKNLLVGHGTRHGTGGIKKPHFAGYVLGRFTGQ